MDTPLDIHSYSMVTIPPWHPRVYYPPRYRSPTTIQSLILEDSIPKGVVVEGGEVSIRVTLLFLYPFP